LGIVPGIVLVPVFTGVVFNSLLDYSPRHHLKASPWAIYAHGKHALWFSNARSLVVPLRQHFRNQAPRC